jgi:effector-binding domain-containing protein
MPRITNIEILQKNEQPTLSIRKRTQVEKLPMLIGECYGKMAAYLKETDQLLADVPFVAYHNMDMQNLDVEMGFPLSQPLSGQGDIKAGCIPAGRLVFCMYRGPYSEIETTYNEMAKWIKDNGYKAIGTFYEYYYNGPEFPESEALTMIAMPLAFQ